MRASRSGVVAVLLPASLVALVAFVTLATAGCGRRAYQADVVALCDAEQRVPRQGSTRLEQLDRAVMTLAPTLRTDEGRRLAGRLLGSDVEPASVLRIEAARAHVSPCALADAYARERERLQWEHDLRELCGWPVEDVDAATLLTTAGARLHADLRLLDASERRARLRIESDAAGFAGCAQAKRR
jgi:hypothetical protein